MQGPTIGRTVHVLVEEHRNNGSDTAPAIITRVWEDGTINVHVLLDGPAFEWISGVLLVAERPEPRAARALSLDNRVVAWWPPRT